MHRKTQQKTPGRGGLGAFCFFGYADNISGQEVCQMIDRVKVGLHLSEGGDIAAANRFVDCGTPGKGWVGTCATDPTHTEVYHPFSCMLRICPTCAGRRAAQLAAAVEEPIEDLVNSSPPGYSLKHVIFTTSVELTSNVDDLRAVVKLYRIGVREIIQSMFPRDKKMGGLIGAEFGENGRKLHFHVLLLSRYINKAELERRWEQITGGAGRWTFIRKLVLVSDGLAEICKYVTKPTAGSGENLELVLVQLHFVLKGIRRLQAFGVFFKMDRDENECSGVCPDCGGVLFWTDEITWSESRKKSVTWLDDSSLYLKAANKSPPSGYKQLGFDAVKCGFLPPTPLSYP